MTRHGPAHAAEQDDLPVPPNWSPSTLVSSSGSLPEPALPEPPGLLPEPPGLLPEPPGLLPEPPGLLPEPPGSLPEPTVSLPVRVVPMPMPIPTSRQHVTCPECGRQSAISINRRESDDFCGDCDYPLFWSAGNVVIDGSEVAGAGSMRRLPGTAGRVQQAFAVCPTCDEPNPATAETCLRCGTAMRPTPAYAPPSPEPEPEPLWPEPDRPVARRRRSPLWLWAPLAVIGVVVVGWVTISILRAFV